MTTEISITDLQRDTGESARTLQYWSDLGVFRPLRHTNKRGRGVQRMFLAEPPLYGERTWALVASELNRWRIPIGIISEIISMMRWMYGEREGRPDKWAGESLKLNPIARAIAGDQVLILITYLDQSAISVEEMGIERPSDPPATEEIDAFHISIDENWNSTSRTEKGLRYGGRTVTISDRLLAENSSAHILNLTRVLRPLRGG